MKAIAQSTINRMNVSFQRMLQEDTPRQAAERVAVYYRNMTLVEVDGNDFDGVALYRSPNGRYCTCWFGSDYGDQGFDDNLDIWE